MLFVAEIADWTEVVERGGLIGLLLIAVWAFITGRVVSRSAYESSLIAERERAKEWRDLAIGAIDRIDRAVAIAKDRS